MSWALFLSALLQLVVIASSLEMRSLLASIMYNRRHVQVLGRKNDLSIVNGDRH